MDKETAGPATEQIPSEGIQSAGALLSHRQRQRVAVSAERGAGHARRIVEQQPDELPFSPPELLQPRPPGEQPRFPRGGPLSGWHIS